MADYAGRDGADYLVLTDQQQEAYPHGLCPIPIQGKRRTIALAATQWIGAASGGPCRVWKARPSVVSRVYTQRRNAPSEKRLRVLVSVWASVKNSCFVQARYLGSKADINPRGLHCSHPYRSNETSEAFREPANG
jgi:hypothetical protein